MKNLILIALKASGKGDPIQGFFDFIGIIAIIVMLLYLLFKGIEKWRIKKGLDITFNKIKSKDK